MRSTIMFLSSFILSASLIFSPALANANGGGDEGRQCAQTCIQPYKNKINELNAFYDYSTRLDPENLPQICPIYREAGQCAKKCEQSHAAKSYQLANFDMEVPCNEQFQDKFELYGACLGRALRSKSSSCRRTCRRSGTRAANEYLSSKPSLLDVASARRVVEECHLTKCTPDCLSKHIHVHCGKMDKNGGSKGSKSATEAVKLYTEWQRDLLVNHHVQKYTADKGTNKDLPEECQWALTSEYTQPVAELQTDSAPQFSSVTQVIFACGAVLLVVMRL